MSIHRRTGSDKTRTSRTAYELATDPPPKRKGNRYPHNIERRRQQAAGAVIRFRSMINAMNWRSK